MKGDARGMSRDHRGTPCAPTLMSGLMDGLMDEEFLDHEFARRS